MEREIIFLKQVKKEIEEFPFNIRKEILDTLMLLKLGHMLLMPLDRNLSSILPSLHELRFKDQAGQYRVVYWIKTADGIYIVHAFKKKTQKLPQKNIDLILKRIREIK